MASSIYKTSHLVMTKTLEKTGVVRTNTATFQNCTVKGDPEKFHSGCACVSKGIGYRDNSGKQEDLKETVKTYGVPDQIAEEIGQRKIIIKNLKETAKTDGQKMGSTLTSHSVVKNTVLNASEVRTTSKTFQKYSSGGIDAALRKLDINPEKFYSGGTRTTETTVYRDSSGKFENTVETYEDHDLIVKEIEQRKDIVKNFKEAAKTDPPKMGSTLRKNQSETREVKLRKKPKVQQTGTDLVSFRHDCLKAHNEYRARHGVPNLVLSKKISAYSQEWAEHLAATDTFEHQEKDQKHGENIFMKWSSDPNHTHIIKGKEAVDSWYSEIKDHEFGKEPTSLKSGHFTQVIWKDSKELGCGWARSKSGKILVVANYDPAGNFVGKYTRNVPPPKH